MFGSEHLFAPGPRYPSAHAASLVVLPTGALMASWFAGSREGAPDAAVWGSVRGADGWSPPGILADTPGKPEGNSVLWLDPGGVLRLWYVSMEGEGWATCVVRERRSPDLARTWGPDAYIQRQWGWMVRNEPLVLSRRVLMPMYDERDWSAFVLVSEDGGESWQESDRVRCAVGIIQPALAPLSDGGLLMFLRSRGGAVYRSFSADGCGLRWTPPEPTSLPNPNSAVEVIRLQGGALLLVFNPTTHGRSPLRAALSHDQGETWETWRDLESGAGEFSYPAAVQTADGLIHALYTYRRETIAHAWFDEAWVRRG